MSNKSRYIVVLHTFFVHSRDWKIVELGDLTEEQAYEKAKILCHDKNRGMEDCDFTVLEIGPSERLIKRQGLFKKAWVYLFGGDLQT